MMTALFIMESLSSKMFSAAQGFFRLAADGAGRGRGRHMNCIAVHIDATALFYDTVCIRYFSATALLKYSFCMVRVNNVF